MDDVDFYARVVAHGRVLGLGPEGSPDDWESLLGDAHLDDLRGTYGRRDHGLLELSLQRAGGTWECRGISVQVHRLAAGTPGLVPQPLLREFGGFRGHLPLARLVDGLAGLGATLGTEPQQGAPDGDFRVLGVRGGEHRVRVVVVRREFGGFARDDVWSITVGPLP
ncbi:hypothetical protein [Streptomyces sp. NPDC054784]